MEFKRSNETRAAMSASKRVKRSEDPEKWERFRSFYLEQLNKMNEKQAVAS